ALAGPAEISGIEKVYLRAGPGTDTAPIGVLKAGDQVNILDVQGSWTKIETQEGTVGFVYHRYIVPRLDSTPPEAAPQVIAPQSSVAAVPPGSGVAAPNDATPAPSPTEEAGAAKDELSAELASLRAEIADLKQKVQERVDETGEVQAPSGGSVSSIPAGNAPAAPPATSAREQGIGVLAVALLSLLVGWVLGSAFGRRRSRSQRPRLRL
ncbi:MAG TPA: SH3 domain-containing protein, partial [Candidatus Binatia bacterium]|nr:SH3 domain-containing protein [Candidatus Binatia bacterium]